MYKQCKVIAICNNTSPILGQLCTNRIEMFLWTQSHIDHNVIDTLPEYKKINTFHLYVLSDEKIEKGDLVFDMDNPQLSTKVIINDDGSCNNSTGYLKIIASTNLSFNLSELPQEFITNYIELYNKDNKIEDVLVEYEYIPGGRTDIINIWEKGYGLQLKLNSDNTINIKELKNSYTREEVISLLKTFRNELLTTEKTGIEYTDKFITEIL
jgi:hypothetical protein